MKGAHGSPIIIVGMHRSGTSFLAEAMEQLGVFMGARQERHHEARFFLRVNEWLFNQCGAAWDYPQAFEALERDADAQRFLAEYLDAVVNGTRGLSYLGVQRFLRYGRIPSLGKAWGWKDPRNTYTLPIWLRIFPDARIVHITRHGLDVAESLRRRYVNSLAKHTRYMRIWRTAARVGLRRKRFIDSVRCQTVDGGFTLWTEYMTKARKHVAALGDRAIEIQYEKLLRDPAPELVRVAEFCGVQPDGLEAIAAGIKTDRGLAYVKDPVLRAMGEANAETLRAFGY